MTGVCLPHNNRLLTLTGNSLEGALPEAWGGASSAFPKLSILALNGNRLSGGLPASWATPQAFPSMRGAGSGMCARPRPDPILHHLTQLSSDKRPDFVSVPGRLCASLLEGVSECILWWPVQRAAARERADDRGGTPGPAVPGAALGRHRPLHHLRRPPLRRCVMCAPSPPLHGSQTCVTRAGTVLRQPGVMAAMSN